MKANVHVDTARLMREIRDEFDVHHFVETGTNVGETAEWASEQFVHVSTIELDRDLYEEATNTRGHIENIDFIHGTSQEELEHVLPDIDGQAVVHLDAHCGGKWAASAGETLEQSDLDVCPVLDELAILADHNTAHFLFIDDARVFTAPRRRPFDMDAWPDIQTLMRAIEEIDPAYHVIIYKDEVIAVPPDGRQFVRERIRDYRSVERTLLVRIKLKVMNTVWKYASLSGPTRDC